MQNKSQIWECKIGAVDLAKLPSGSDFPMRQAVKQAYFEITGEWPEFCFSGWNGGLDPIQPELVDEDRAKGVSGV